MNTEKVTTIKETNRIFTLFGHFVKPRDEALFSYRVCEGSKVESAFVKVYIYCYQAIPHTQAQLWLVAATIHEVNHGSPRSVGVTRLK